MPGNLDRAHAGMTTATHVRAFASDGIPEPFQTSRYADRFSLSRVNGAHADDPLFRSPRAEAPGDHRSWELVLDEVVLIRNTGDDPMRAVQIARLLEPGRLPRVVVRVLRLDQAAPLPFSHLVERRFPAGRRLHRENGFTYTGRRLGDERALMLDRALEDASSAEDSRAHLAEVHQRLVADRTEGGR